MKQSSLHRLQKLANRSLQTKHHDLTDRSRHLQETYTVHHQLTLMMTSAQCLQQQQQSFTRGTTPSPGQTTDTPGLKPFTLNLFALQLSKKPLSAVEFVAPLARIDPIYKEEEEAFKVRTGHYLTSEKCS